MFYFTRRESVKTGSFEGALSSVFLIVKSERQRLWKICRVIN
ncbi:hypothetical protein Pan241w_35010 [Gimesia alba]|uniref:Uncharacterized protein n=1 Tax=Gimesia alba TaxID=2527973 RepID=A0A517RHP6_9PLAN|nr:hypothetical protein Pan241w_35010 [Gimesia alba]